MDAFFPAVRMGLRGSVPAWRFFLSDVRSLRGEGRRHPTSQGWRRAAPTTMILINPLPGWRTFARQAWDRMWGGLLLMEVWT
jgi:hypothetical protein